MSASPPSPRTPVIDYAHPAQRAGAPWKSLLGWVLFIGLAVMLFLLMNNRQVRTAWSEIPLSEVRSRLLGGEVAEVIIEADEIRGRFTGPKNIRSISATGVVQFRSGLPNDMGSNWSFVNWVLENSRGAVVRVESRDNPLMNILLPLVPWLLIFAFIWFFVFRQLRRSAAQPAQQPPIPVVIVNPEDRPS